MNLVIETLNVWGDDALQLAWPMLWQSSLLIGLLFSLDLLMRRKVRPAVRYALWLVVLVKLLLPPSLAFPTGPTWWLHATKAAPARPRPISVVVTYDATPAPALPATATPVFVAPPKPHLTPPAWAFLGMVIVSLGLLAWMLMRWHRVVRDARRAATAPGWLSELLRELRQPAQLSRVSPLGARTKEPQRPEERGERSGEEGAQTNHPSGGDPQGSETCLPLPPSLLGGLTGRSSTAWLRLRLTDHPQSPAVCGLFRPVILLPRSLAEHLSPAQLRAVLLHELLHLRRGDVWVNCAQALLQIAYWWHPLLWLSNARIRRVREEAVDDAVMLALNEDAEAYAPTLLEVAKLALPRPLASLGLVGILESRSSLRQRIERLMDFHPPRRAGLTLGAALAVLGFAAVAVPMGPAPAPAEAPQSAGSEAATNSFPLPASTNSAWLVQKVTVSTLVKDGKLLYEMGKLNEAQAKLELALKQDPQNPAAKYYLELVGQARLSQDGDKRHSLPSPVPYARTNLIRGTAGRQAIFHKLDIIRMNEVSFDGLPLGEVLRTLADETKKRDPEKQGINFIIRSPELAKSPWETGLDSLTGLPKQAKPAEAVDPSSIVITLKHPLTNIRLADVLDAIAKAASQPLKYSIEDYAIVFSAKTGRESPPLYSQTYKVDPNTLLEGLHIANSSAATNRLEAIAHALADYFDKAGVDLNPMRHPGKALFYNEREGKLFVRAALQDQQIIDYKIAVLNTAPPPPQINIKCKFVEVSLNDVKNTGFDWYLGTILTTNGAVGGQPGIAPKEVGPSSTSPPSISSLGNSSTSPFKLTGILTDPQFRAVIKALQQRSETELLAQPEVTTSSGRQAQAKTVIIQHVLQGINEQALTPPGITTTNGDESSLYVTESMEFGRTLDVTASVLDDGYTVALTVTRSVTEFLGYAEGQTNRVAVYVNGAKKWVFPPEPNVRRRQMSTTMQVWDGQTAVLGGLVSEMVPEMAPEIASTIKDQVPMLADLPLLGGWFRGEFKTPRKKNLLILVTPTLIDTAGNRIHTEEELRFTREAVPPQPAR